MKNDRQPLYLTKSGRVAKPPASRLYVIKLGRGNVVRRRATSRREALRLEAHAVWSRIRRRLDANDPAALAPTPRQVSILRLAYVNGLLPGGSAYQFVEDLRS